MICLQEATLFVLQGFDSVTENVCVEWRINICDMDRLRSVLAPDSHDDPNLERTYYGLSEQEIRQIGQLCHPPIVPPTIYTGLSRPDLESDSVPYLIHTNFELPLMLEGRKPLAVFSDGYPSDWFDEYLAPFERFVLSGQIIRRIIETPLPDLKRHRPDLEGIRDVLFALPGEERRIDAYIRDIKNRVRDWDDELERLQGSLLGYEDWQNDWWIEQRVKRRETNN